MAQMTAKKTSIEEKLMLARLEFGKADKQKSGKNDHAMFKYYELSDIVPIAMEIFQTLGLAYVLNVIGNDAIGKLIDIETKDFIEFHIPFVTLEDAAKFRQNSIQANGSALTYTRRYMLMQILEICEPDAYDCGIEPTEEKPKVKPAKTTEEREEIKKELVSKCDEVYVEKLKKVCSKLKELGETDFVHKVVLDTEKFTKMDNALAETYIKSGTEILKKLKESK